ncbi:hypothetical protein [Hydrogenophaga sp.]|uniref:hypothetical protein n=1 Tax=Hydrogenophaga sp. TaxID=1904254 RepID=UPI0026249C34|nr:hypothetical protein [Hydrogenophaga sp.]MDM7948604.1 hypothetical protein [Hydrogenophaga sp.]
MNAGRKQPWWASAVLLAAALAIGSEVLTRWVLGLGTPPLYEADAGYEYRLRPDQDLYRFGNHILVNRWGMRSEDFGKTKANPSERRIMVFGDSVVNGGSEIGHEALATTQLRQELQTTLARPVTVGNISAGSWGPGNWLAYATRFGFFQADLVILVVGSGDARDNPAFAPLTINQPTHKPALALEEAVTRYLPRYLPENLARMVSGQPESPPANQTSALASGPDPIEQGLDDLRRFLTLARSEGRQVVVLHHPDRSETETGRMAAGHAEIAALVEGMGLPWIGLRDSYRQTDQPVYRDAVHLSAAGQRTLARELLRVVTPLLSADEPVASSRRDSRRDVA